MIAASNSGGEMAWFVTELKQLAGPNWHRRVGATIVVAEFDLVDTGSQPFGDRANLATHEVTDVDVFEQRH